MRASIAAVVLAAARLDACAQDTIEVYRCVGPDGHVALQDEPCAGGAREQSRRQVTAEPDTTPKPAPPAPVQEPPPDAPPAVMIVQRPPDAELWECVDFDGKTRESMYDDPRPRYVPAWVVGMDPRGVGGLGGALQPPRDPAMPPRQYVGGELQVLVADQCHRLPPEVACVRFRERHSGMDKRIFNAAPFEGTKLKREKAELEAILSTRCG